MSKVKYTPLGEVYYAAEEWQRRKILAELELIGIPYPTLRSYCTRVKGFRVPADVQKIILKTIPEAVDCFNRPMPEAIQSSEIKPVSV